MAAPQVSGLAALLFAQAPGRSRSTVIARIESTAHALSGAGYGLIDVRRALGVSGSTGSPTPTRTPTQRPTTPATAKASPTPAVTRPTALTPPPSPKPSPTTVTSVTPTSAPTPRPTIVVGVPAGKDDGVPTPLAVGAGLLALLAVGTLVNVARR
jgi:hypothetical protein